MVRGYWCRSVGFRLRIGLWSAASVFLLEQPFCARSFSGTFILPRAWTGLQRVRTVALCPACACGALEGFKGSLLKTGKGPTFSVRPYGRHFGDVTAARRASGKKDAPGRPQKGMGVPPASLTSTGRVNGGQASATQPAGEPLHWDIPRPLPLPSPCLITTTSDHANDHFLI